MNYKPAGKRHTGRPKIRCGS